MSNLKEIKIVSRWDKDKILLCGKYESIKDCLEKNRSANLYGANLSGAYLSRADLYGANLSGANLSGAKNYYNSHDFALEIIRRRSVKTFTDKEWSVIGQIAVHRFCWDTIKKEYDKTALSLLKKLAKTGFDEFYNHFTNRGE